MPSAKTCKEAYLRVKQGPATHGAPYLGLLLNSRNTVFEMAMIPISQMRKLRPAYILHFWGMRIQEMLQELGD